MDANKLGSRSQTLSDLVRQLRLHNPSYPVNDSDIRGCDNNPPTSRTHRRAAVLICIFEGEDGDLRVILTVRSSTLSSHSGEVALPGGKMEEGEIDEAATALREAKEEIGLDPSLVEVVSILGPFTMKVLCSFHLKLYGLSFISSRKQPLYWLENGMVVVPVVGLLFDKLAFCPSPNAAEVEVIFDAPLQMFLKNENRREVERDWMGEKYLLHYFDYEANGSKYAIFALTAGILIETASMVYQQSPAFEERKPKFWNKISTSSS